MEGQEGRMEQCVPRSRLCGNSETPTAAPRTSHQEALLCCVSRIRVRGLGGLVVQRVGRECTGHFQRHSLVIKIPVSVAHKKYSKNQSREPGTGHQNQRSREAGTRLPGKRACVSTFPRHSVQEGK